MSLLELLRVLVQSGAAVTPREGTLEISAPADAVTPAIRVALKDHKRALLSATDPARVAAAWRVPHCVQLSATLLTILAWLLAERARFARPDWRRWVEHKTAHIDAGASPYVADILATEAVARAELAAAMSTVMRAAA